MEETIVASTSLRRVVLTDAREPLARSALRWDKVREMASRAIWVLVVAALYALHQDVWFWRSARPLLGGVLPVGLTYHAAYCLASAALMWALTSYAWPSQLDARAASPRGAPSRGVDAKDRPC